MSLESCLYENESILMEGALGERLKREYGIEFDADVAMATLIYTKKGKAALYELWTQYIKIAEQHSLPFIATTPTRRANVERASKAGFGSEIIYDNVEFLKSLRSNKTEMYIGGLMGCAGDAYTGEGALSRPDAASFHSWQANSFKEAEVDFLYAGIMPTLNETAGMADAMAATGLPYIISFTINADGCLIDGTPIHDAICEIDATTKAKPLCYMTNCVHPNIAYEALSQSFNQTIEVRTRFLGIQANTSPLPYCELDASTDLKSSDPISFAKDMIRLKHTMHLKIMGGCCGTDSRHMSELAHLLTK